jgi:hypothetical protein
MNDALFEEWHAYQKVVDNDYIHHVEFFGCIEEQVRQDFVRPVSILDLGCGA